MSGDSQVRVERVERGGGFVATVVLDNARRLNSMNSALMAEFVEKLEGLAREDDLRALILTGDGDKSFVGGADIKEMGAIKSPHDARAFITRVHGCCHAVRAIPAPTIARINGFCFGAGFELAAACDLPGLRPLLGDVGVVPAEPSRISMFGIRSVDPGERALLRKYGVHVHDMRALDEHGVAVLTRMALAAAEAENAILHVSFDVDFLEPDIAPGVGTTVPGGATFREAHLMMEMIHESGRVGSVDLVELNPFLDERGRSARLLTDLAASLFGRTVMDRPTQSSWSTPAATALQEQD